MTTPLLDADARQTFAECLTENFCVSAGAGVGKTTAIVRRIASLARLRREQPDLLSRLAVVTYGKLAAEELRVRTRDLILEQLDASAAGRQTLLADLRGAFFGTIHSFCLKLIRDHGRALGLPADADLLEERTEPLLWERFCESAELTRVDLPPPILERVSRHVSFGELLDLAHEFGPDETDGGAFDPAAPVPVPDFGPALAHDGGKAKAKTAEHQQDLRRWQAEFQEGAPFLKLPEYRGGSGGFLKAVDEALLPYARWLNAAAGFLAARIARAYRDYRLEKGLMTFRDQIFWCRRLIEDPAVLARMRDRGYIVILDEAQDTDAEMFAILTEITRPPNAPPGGWPADKNAAAPLPGRFCFVGDEQQAIYSQRADLAVYRSYVDAFREDRGGRHLAFSVTMRCPRRVITVANAIFAGGRLPQKFVEFRALHPRPDCPEGGAWLLDLGPAPGDGGRPKVEESLARECERIADLLKTQGRAGLGIARWSEVAVICPRIGWLEQAARIFETRGIRGCLLSQKTAAAGLPRYSWPAALFHVLLRPWDRFELIGVLREIFAVSDVDLARLHRTALGGLGFWPQVPAAASHASIPPRLRQALELLHGLRAQLPGSPAADSSRATLSRYADHVLEKTALAARLRAIGEPDALDRLRAQAMAAECAGMTLRAWVCGLVDALEEAAPAGDGGPDAVQFLTGLKAKGLEWPVVIPLGLACTLRAHPDGYPRIERHEGASQIHFCKATLDPAWTAARAARTAEEHQRMLYVTLTRARHLLIAPDGRALYRCPPPHFLQLARWGELDLPALFTPAPAAAGPASGEPPEDALPVEAHAWFEEDADALARAAAIAGNIPKRILPSGLVHGPEAPAAEDDRIESGASAGMPEIDEPLAGVGGVDYGNWWHEVLQHYPWAAASPHERVRYLEAERGKIAGRRDFEARAAEELARLAASEAHAEFLMRGEVFLPEMPFSFPSRPEQWIEGIMDLVIVTREPGDLWIVDWKTDRRRPGDPSDEAFLDRLAEKYGPQLRAYADVFARGLARPVGRLLLYSTALGAVVPVPPA